MNGIQVNYPDGTVYKTWDDDTRIFTQYTQAGALEISRAYTFEENYAADTRVSRAVADADDESDQSMLRAALQANADYLALSPPTNADVIQQVRLLTRITSALIRWMLRHWARTR